MGIREPNLEKGGPTKDHNENGQRGQRLAVEEEKIRRNTSSKNGRRK